MLLALGGRGDNDGALLGLHSDDGGGGNAILPLCGDDDDALLGIMQLSRRRSAACSHRLPMQCVEARLSGGQSIDCC